MKLTDERARPLPEELLETLSKEDLIVRLRNEQRVRVFLEEHVKELEDKVFVFEGKYFRIQSRMFGRSSEKSANSAVNDDKNQKGPKKPRAKTARLPSERYPNAEIINKDITCVELPACKCCGHTMEDSGMVETSEYLTTIPKKIVVVRQHRHKYRCGKCHGDIVTTPAIPRVISGSSYSDEMIIDAALSKFCDLIPMERYCQIAKRMGFEGLPPHSLIAATFALAEFLKQVYELLKRETLATTVLLGDETPHRMLEGDPKMGWFLWGFLNPGVACFYECHDTRSGDVAWKILKESTCTTLLTDVYSGYKKAVRLANEDRIKEQKTEIQMAYCNSHARREFVTTQQDKPEETEYMLARYKEIYKIESEARGKSLEARLKARENMRSIFENMKTHAKTHLDRFPSKSWVAQGFSYFLNNYEGLTVGLTNPHVPLDNNASERMLRSHVVGRKTWYGTHSKDGAEAAAIHFSIVESCKMNGLNPREYYKTIVFDLHQGKPLRTPFQIVNEQNSS